MKTKAEKRKAADDKQKQLDEEVGVGIIKIRTYYLKSIVTNGFYIKVMHNIQSKNLHVDIYNSFKFLCTLEPNAISFLSHFCHALLAS